MSLYKRMAAEFLGTFWLVLGGCGAAVLAAGVPTMGIGYAGVALAFGLTVLTMAYAIGPISGCHLNPAVTVGLCFGKRFPASEMGAYIVSQVMGAVCGAAVLYTIAQGNGMLDMSAGFAANGYGLHSPGLYEWEACFLAEAVMTFFLVMVFLGATDKPVAKGFAPLAVGFCVTLIHLVTIPVTNTSVNPARSFGPALFVGGWAMEQMWLFTLAPLTGAVLAGLIYRALDEDAAARPA